jgi:hypothetical protein
MKPRRWKRNDCCVDAVPDWRAVYQTGDHWRLECLHSKIGA